MKIIDKKNLISVIFLILVNLFYVMGHFLETFLTKDGQVINSILPGIIGLGYYFFFYLIGLPLVGVLLLLMAERRINQSYGKRNAVLSVLLLLSYIPNVIITEYSSWILFDRGLFP
jgi:hypothetical protein